MPQKREDILSSKAFREIYPKAHSDVIDFIDDCFYRYVKKEEVSDKMSGNAAKFVSFLRDDLCKMNNEVSSPPPSTNYTNKPARLNT